MARGQVALRLLGVATLATLALFALSACGGSGGSPGSAALRSQSRSTETVVPLLSLELPAASAGCRGVTRLPGSGLRIPATVSDRRGQVLVLVNVCIEGKGPYPFIVDTGASSTAVDIGLAKRLGLEAASQPERLTGPDCVTVGQERRVRSWSVAGWPLQPQTLTAVRIPQLGGPGEPAGVIGSDVWNRFGQLRVDYRRSELVLPDKERPAPTRPALITKPAGSRLPASIVSGTAQLVAPMIVAVSPHAVRLRIAVGFGSQPAREFVPDTGAAISLIDSSAATTTGLKRLATSVTLSTVCSIVVVPELDTGHWLIPGEAARARALAGNALVPQPIGMLNLQGFDGALGSDQMSRFGSVVFDYAGGRILLGAH